MSGKLIVSGAAHLVKVAPTFVVGVYYPRTGFWSFLRSEGKVRAAAGLEALAEVIMVEEEVIRRLPEVIATYGPDNVLLLRPVHFSVESVVEVDN